MTPTQYRKALDLIVQSLVVGILPVLRRMFRSDLENEATRKRQVDLTARIVVLEVRIARRLVANATEKFLKAQAKDQAGVSDPFIPPLAGYSENAVKTALNDAIDDGGKRSAQERAESAASRFVRHAEQAGRQMVIDAVEPDPGVDDDSIEDQQRDAATDTDGNGAQQGAEGVSPDEQGSDDQAPDNVTPILPDRQDQQRRKRAKDKSRPVAWARALTGAENCAFCVMLASRGAVYKSKGTASRREFDNRKYHDNCDCVAVPVYTSAAWPGKDDADELYRLWLTSTKGYRQLDAINALRRELERKKKAGEPLFHGFTGIRPAA